MVMPLSNQHVHKAHVFSALNLDAYGIDITEMSVAYVSCIGTQHLCEVYLTAFAYYVDVIVPEKMSDGDIDVRPLCCRLRQLHDALLCKQGGHHALAADSLVFLQHFLYADNGLRQALQILLYCKLGRIHLLLFKHRRS